jgi:purine-binding chemotaxis protein CheW
MQSAAVTESTSHEVSLASKEGEKVRSFVTFRVAGHFFGVPVERVQDILIPDAIAFVPGSPREVRGLINLRGRIVTVIDLRVRLGLPASDCKGASCLCVTVEKDNEFYTLLVDKVGDVVTLPERECEHNPPTLDAAWQEMIRGVFRRSDGLLAIFDIDRLLDIRTDDVHTGDIRSAGALRATE